MRLLPNRIKVLEDYVSYVESKKSPNPNEVGLYKFLRKNNLESWYKTDFRAGRGWEEERNEEKTFLSLTYKVPDELKQRVSDAMTLLPHRIEVLEDYVSSVESKISPNSSEVGLCKFLIENNLRSWYRTDFRAGRGWETGEKIDTISSLTYRIEDKELVEKVRMYATQ